MLLPQFDRTPEADQAAIEAAGLWIGKPPGLFAMIADKVVAKAEKSIKEHGKTNDSRTEALQAPRTNQVSFCTVILDRAVASCSPETQVIGL
jgi:hypothetical protein